MIEDHSLIMKKNPEFHFYDETKENFMRTRRLRVAVFAALLFSPQWQSAAEAAWYRYANNTNLLIPTTSSFMGRASILVPDNFTVEDLKVTLDIEHTWVDDLAITLVGPQGSWIGVVGYPNPAMTQPPSIYPNYGMEFVAGAFYTFSDSGKPFSPEPTCLVGCGSWYIPGGEYKPEDYNGFLFKDIFGGENAQGYWHLDIFDNNPVSDGGRLISWRLDFNKTAYYFPAIKDDDAMGWANYLTVQAMDPVPMDVTIKVYDMAGTLKGTYIYSNTDLAANAPAIPPYARVAQRPCLIASGSSTACSVPVEGSMVVETSVPAIATTNTIANSFEGFSIVESAKPRSVHNFPKAFDGPNNYQVSMLVQNIHGSTRTVTATLYGKNASSPGHGAKKTYTIPAYGTLKFRPSDVAGGGDFNGSVVVSSDGTAPGDGLGPAIPAMCRYELGKEALTIYESTVEQPALYFPTVKDGKFGGALDYQNYLSVVNPGTIDATVEVILHTNAGIKKATTGPVVITAGGKATWRPSMILGTITAPVDFEGAVIVTSTAPVVGQTNTMYPGVNTYQCDAFDLFESAIPNTTLFFPKAFDNIVADSHLYDNVVYVQNPDATAKNITIEQFNNNGSANGVRTVPLGPNATYVYRPKDLVTDGTATFRGSVRVTETGGGNIGGAIKYDLHQGTTTSTPVDAMTLYRSMGQ